MSTDEIIDQIIEHEGEGTFPYVVAGDRGGRTRWGISERSHPKAWKYGAPSKEDAREIYLEEYVRPFDWAPSPLKEQLVDFGVTSGRTRAVYWLQRTLGIHADGKVGPVTINAVSTAVSEGWVVPLNNAYVAARLQFIDQITDAEKSQKKFEEGWENRALSFLVLS